MVAFDVRVEVAFDSGFATPAASRNWTDVTPYVEAQNAMTITRGRQDEHSTVSPSTLARLVLNNTDGRFTPELASGAYYPNVKRGRPIRVRVRYPAGQAGNFLSANAASMETDVSAWNAGGTVPPPTLSQSSTHVDNGAKSLLITWGAGVSQVLAQTPITGLTVGRTYTAQARVWVSVGHPDVLLAVGGVLLGAATSTKGAFVSITCTWVATSSTHMLLIWGASSPTAGQQVWVDSVMVDEGAAAQAFTTSPPPILDRFMGYADEWVVDWPTGGDEYATCTVAASSRSARLSNDAALRSIVEEEYRLDAPKMEYTLGDPEGSTTAGNTAATPQNPLSIAQVGAGGTLTFGTGTGPPTDSLTAAVLARASAGNGKYLIAAIPTALTGFFDSVLDLDVFFNTSTAAVQTLVGLWFDSSNYLLLSIDATGKLAATAKVVDSTGTVQTRTVTSAGSVADGATHYGALRVVLADGATPTATVSVITDSGVVTGATIPWVSYAGITFFPAYSQLVVGGPLPSPKNAPGDAFNGTLAHVGVYVQDSTPMPDARFLAHYNAGNNGFAGETAQARIARYASYLGVPAAEVIAETGLLVGVAHVDTTGASALDLMQRVATSESGLLFDDRSGNLTFQARSHRYNASPALTLDVSAQEVEADFAPELDDQGLLNDLTASRPNGLVIRSTNEASIEDNGYYRDDLEILTVSDAEVQSAADWKVSQFGTPHPKAPALSLDLLTFPTPAKLATALSVDLGAQVAVTNLPAQAPAPTVAYFIEGAVETIGIANFDVTWNVSPAATNAVWQLDSPSYSQLDSSTVLAY